MAIRNLRWVPRMGYKVFSFPGVKFRGRQPFSATSDAHKKALLDLGVFEELPDGTLRYKAPIGIRLDDGTKAMVDQNGIVRIDTARVASDLVNISYELIDEATAIPQPGYTLGIDHPDSDPTRSR